MIGQHPGAVWRRVDLQCHTPRDVGWTGSEGIAGHDETGLAARDAWGETFIAVARDKGLSILAVTDHHDVAMLPHVIRAGQRADVLILPGIEVTCRDSVQVLAIFDPSAPPSIWERFLGKLPEVRLTDPMLPRVGPLTECGLTVAGLFDIVAQDVSLAPVTMLIPHFGPSSAYKSLNVSGHAARARDLQHDAVYVECAYSALDAPTIDKIQGRVLEWGNELAPVSPDTQAVTV